MSIFRMRPRVVVLGAAVAALGGLMAVPAPVGAAAPSGNLSRLANRALHSPGASAPMSTTAVPPTSWRGS
jgi:hypothetical protein